jgi:uncharacterized protein YjiS (DUF1127 family)
MSTSNEAERFAAPEAPHSAPTGNPLTIVAQRATAGNDATAAEWPTHYELYLAARAQRAFALGEIAAAVIQGVASLAKRLRLRYEKSRRTAAARAALRALDDRTLHDIGLDRSEIASVTAETQGDAEPSRAQVVQMWRPASDLRTPS